MKNWTNGKKQQEENKKNVPNKNSKLKLIKTITSDDLLSCFTHYTHSVKRKGDVRQEKAGERQEKLKESGLLCGRMKSRF